MHIVESLGLVCFAGVFLLGYIGVMAAIAIVSTQAKQQSARQILDAQARGAFTDLATQKNKFRFRLLAGLALFGVLGMGLALAILVIQMATKFSNLYWVTIVVALIFVSIGAVAGFLMQREINRRV